MNDRYAEDEEAPHSRLFVVGSRDLREEEINKVFGKFGRIRDVWAVKDRNTGNHKGIFFVKFYKTSDAALALEETKGIDLGGRPLKVMVATNREAGADAKNDIDEENLKRLFIVVSKTATDDEIKNYFQQFGPLVFANIVQDKETKKNKPFAYVKFQKFSDAAIAFEQCDRKYKAVFAKPRKSRAELQNVKGDFLQSTRGAIFQSFAADSRHQSTDFKEDGYFPLTVVASPMVNQSQLWKLFDIVPSMDYCQAQYDNTSGHTNRFEVVYKNESWAVYAIEKFHGFEYPPGERLIVKANTTPESSFNNNSRQKRPAPADFGSNTSEIMRLAETIAQASSLIQKAGITTDRPRLGLLPDPYDDAVIYSKQLPPRKPLSDPDSTVAARCFIVCSPSPLSPAVLRDMFSRFGDLVDVYILQKKSCGFAKFASKQSAERAIEVLNGIEVQGIRVKVVEAEERPDKRQKMDKSNDSEY